jgi:hypothetical protein
MTFLVAFLVGSALPPGVEPEKAVTLKYVRRVEGQFIKESEVTLTRSGRGATYTSTTERGDEKMTLTLHFDEKNHIRTAEASLTDAKGTRTATLTLADRHIQFKRAGTTDFIKTGPDPILTTAPDWSDVFQLVSRYDARKGGRQEFAGVWFHPVEGTRTLTFAVERVGQDKITLKEEEVKLDRYHVRLRSGDYAVWLDSAGRVIKILPRGAGSSPVVLEGYEEATRELVP